MREAKGSKEILCPSELCEQALKTYGKNNEVKGVDILNFCVFYPLQQ